MKFYQKTGLGLAVMAFILTYGNFSILHDKPPHNWSFIGRIIFSAVIGLATSGYMAIRQKQLEVKYSES